MNKIRYNANRSLLWQTSIPGRGLSVAHLTAGSDEKRPNNKLSILVNKCILRECASFAHSNIRVYHLRISIFTQDRCQLRGKNGQHMRRRALVLCFYSNEFSGHLHVLKINICGVRRCGVITEAFHGGTYVVPRQHKLIKPRPWRVNCENNLDPLRSFLLDS